MKERYKVLAVMVLLSLGLWYGIGRFLGSTTDFAEKLDTRSTAYMEKKSSDPDPQEKATEPAPSTEKPASLNQKGEIITVETVAADDARQDAEAEADTDGEESSPDNDKPENEDRADSDKDIREQKTDEQSAASDEDDISKRIVLVKTGKSLKEQELLEQLDKDLLKGPAPTRALDIRLILEKRGCQMTADERTRTGVLFRHESAAIKGSSLNRLDGLINLYRRCGGTLQLQHNPQGQADANELLKQRRQDEVKYYFLQRSIPKASIEFPESS